MLDFVEKPKGDRKTSKSLLMAFVEDPNQKTLWKTKIRRLQLKLQTGRATIMSDDDSSGLSSTDAVLLKVIKQEQEVRFPLFSSLLFSSLLFSSLLFSSSL